MATSREHAWLTRGKEKKKHFTFPILIKLKIKKSKQY